MTSSDARFGRFFYLCNGSLAFREDSFTLQLDTPAVVTVVLPLASFKGEIGNVKKQEEEASGWKKVPREKCCDEFSHCNGAFVRAADGGRIPV